MEDFKTKCGEIYITVKGIIAFHCTLCENKFNGYEEYMKHINVQHQVNLKDKKMSEDIKPKSVLDAEKNNEILEVVVPVYDIKTGIKCKMKKSDNLKKQIEANKKTRTISTDSEIVQKPIPKWKQYCDIVICPKTNEKRFKCKLCGVSIRDKTNVSHHIGRLHEKTKEHKCTECKKSYFSRTELKIHFRKHTGEKPYLCIECGVAFESSSKLTAHSVKHSKQIRDQFCPICKKGFFSMQQLRKHKNTVHSEKRPFKCESCDASFKRRTSLKTHLRIHENKRDYRCNLCSASYNYKSILVSHMKTKHSVATETILLVNN